VSKEHLIARAFTKRSDCRELSPRMAKALRWIRREYPREGIMKTFGVVFLMLFLAGVFEPLSLRGNEFKEREAKIAQYKKWLDTLGPEGSQYWTRLESRKRPHRLYLGEAFYRADLQSQASFVDTFSNYLAGHPEKFMLIDLFDAKTDKSVGEYGFGGFKLYAKPGQTAGSPQE
jgi:hypothetical protein